MSLSRGLPLEAPLCVVMVGLPARGKTYTARKLARYFGWLGYKTHVFNVGNYRRERFGAHVAHDFFDPDNIDGLEARKAAALEALGDLLDWMRQGGQIGIYDATNSTRSRRKMVCSALERAGVEVLLLETVCNDEGLVEANIRESKLSNPDYSGMEPDVAVADFRARILHYVQAYEPLEEEEQSFIRVIDVGRRIELNRIQGFRMGRIVNFVMNLHIAPRPIWLSRHGESLANVVGTLGGDPDLSEDGYRYAQSLCGFVDLRIDGGPLSVWTSTLQRTILTAAPLQRQTLELRALDEIDAGICDGFTYAQVAAKYPEEFAARATDKLRYRYPRGESYEDVIDRLNPLIIELERQTDPILVVAHQAVLRALYGYFVGRSREEVPHLDVPLHTIIELTPKAYGCDERRFLLPPGAR
jgi:broad specificity phosphatase PhoE/predicted kinase